MRLEHRFRVPSGIDEAFTILRDVERIAPCMPGARLGRVDGDEFSGEVAVKVGPMQVVYQGTARFLEVDEAARRTVIEARGKEARGSGLVSATITAQLTEHGAETEATLVTDLTINGRLAQFGRGIIVEVSNNLLGQFATCLARQIEERPAQVTPLAGEGDVPAGTVPAVAPESGPTAVGSTSLASAPVPASRPLLSPPAEPESLDLLRSAARPVLKRLLPVLLVLVLAVLARAAFGRSSAT